MENKVYEEAKQMLQALASKVPGTWDMLVQENQRRAIVMSLLLVALACAAAYICRRASRLAISADDAQSIGGILGTLLSLVAFVLFTLGAIQNIGVACAPNIETAKTLLGR